MVILIYGKGYKEYWLTQFELEQLKTGDVIRYNDYSNTCKWFEFEFHEPYHFNNAWTVEIVACDCNMQINNGHVSGQMVLLTGQYFWHRVVVVKRASDMKQPHPLKQLKQSLESIKN